MIGQKLLSITNRQSHVRFRLVPKSTTLGDLERPLHTLLIMRFPNMQTFAVFSAERPSNEVGWLKMAIFSNFGRYIFRTFRDKIDIIKQRHEVCIEFPVTLTMRDVE